MTVPFLCHCINEPVDDEYFNDINKIRGLYKPEPPPVIDLITAEYIDSEALYSITVDFSSTTTKDPDTGTPDNLTYYLYYSLTDPALFASGNEFYNESRMAAAVLESDFTGPEKKITVYADKLNRTVYFWLTAMDDGRESDHSNIVSIAL